MTTKPVMLLTFSMVKVYLRVVGERRVGVLLDCEVRIMAPRVSLGDRNVVVVVTVDARA